MTKLTIGLPVYNGAKLLAGSLDRLLAQTFTDFELVISDNASTDATADICADYARRDPRIRYIRQPETVVWNENFRLTLADAQTPYFMWATHDDIWLPRFAEANIEMLERNPQAVCSVSKVVYFDASGFERLAPDTGPLLGTPGQRIGKFFRELDTCAQLYGVYRTDVLRDCVLPHMLMFGADWLIVALALQAGDQFEVDEVLLRREMSRLYGHYHQAVGRNAVWQPRWFEAFVPLHRLKRELRARVTPQTWREIRGAVAYMELRLLANVPEAYLPGLRALIGPVRRAIGRRLHYRWRSSKPV